MDLTLKDIVDYVNDLEQDLYCWDGNCFEWQNELYKLQVCIKKLMLLISKESNKANRAYLAIIEYRARKCRECILIRSGMIN